MLYRINTFQSRFDLTVNKSSLLESIDEKKPLLTMHQEQEPLESIPANRPSAAIMDVSENLRAKIYALFCRLGECEERE